MNIQPPNYKPKQILQETGERFSLYTCDDYFNAIVKIKFPFFGSNHTVEFLQKLGLAGKIAFDSNNVKKPKYGASHREIHIKFHFTQDWALKQTTDHLDQIFNPDYLSYKISYELEFKDNWDVLKYLWDTMDWTYMFSDDGGVWAAGNAKEAHYLALAKALAKVDRARVLEMAKGYKELNLEYFTQKLGS